VIFVGSTAVARGANRAARLFKNASAAVPPIAKNAAMNAHCVSMAIAEDVLSIANASSANHLVAMIVDRGATIVNALDANNAMIT
jgi:predicted LPLAT superfamily acyltransferase